ncbi:MAG: tetratricopeptide repeat protein [Patescibacteria group bacterium]|nr:tetratricopeptide repeat protein [Patescibacteria group bacterium]
MEVFQTQKPRFFSSLFHRESFSWANLIIKASVYLSVIFTPLFFLTATPGVFDFNKSLLFCILTLIGVMAWLGQMVFQKKVNFRRSFLDVPVVVFGLIYLVVTLFSKNWYVSLAGVTNYYHHTFILVMFFVLFYFLVVNNFRSLKEIVKLVVAFLVSSALVGLVALLQMFKVYVFLSDTTKTQGFNLLFNSALVLGIFMAVVLPLMLGFLMFVKKPLPRFLLALGCLIDFAVLFLLDMNLVWYTVIGGLFVFLIFLTLKSRELESRWVILPTILLVLSAVLIFVDVPSLTDISLSEDVVLSQQTTWSVATSTLKSSPLFGIGPELFDRALALHRPIAFNNTDLWNLSFIKGSSEFLQILITTGTLATIVLLFLLVRFGIKLLRQAIKDRSEAFTWMLRSTLFTAWAMLFAVGFFYPYCFILSFTLWLLIALGVCTVTENKEETIKTQPTGASGFMSSIIFSLVVVLGLVFLYVAGTVWLAENHYVRGSRALAQSDYQTAEKQFNRAIELNDRESAYHFALAQSLVTEIQILASDQNFSDATKFNQLVTQALISLNDGLSLDKTDAMAYQNFISIYSGLDQLVPSVYSDLSGIFDQWIEHDKNNPLAYIEAGDNSVLMGQAIAASITEDNKDQAAELTEQSKQAYAKAQTYYQKAAELKTDYAVAEFKHEVVYELLGDPSKATTGLEALATRYPDVVDIKYELGQLYLAADKKDQAKQMFVDVLNISPNHANAAYQLGEIILAEGDRDGAITLFKRIYDNNPNNATIKQKLQDLGVTL